jgi:integrase
MQINYLDAVSSVLNMMRQPDSACKNIDMHRTCYTTFFKHLMDKGIPFSMDAALDWLEIKKQEISYEACSQYRNALFRLAYELEEYYAANQNPSYYHTYSVATKEFFRLATSLGITEPEAVTIDTLIEYWNTYCKSCGSPVRRQNAVCAMTALMKYLHLRGDVPECYQLVLFGGNAEILPGMRLSKTGTAFHPSVSLEHKAEEYLDALNDWKYMESSKAVYRNDFTWYFMFLELNRLEHSAETVTLWTDMLPDCPDQAKGSNPVSARRSHTIRMFEKYLQGTMESNMSADAERAPDHLPPWSKSILDDFIESRRRDGMADSTLTMCRAAGCSFFKYLEDNGIDHPASITSDAVKAFRNHDVHSTPESKNAYGAKLRQLLCYMAGQELVPPTLVFAVSASCAPRRSIVDVLSDDMVGKIYEYRAKASTPIELRDTAMVMLGLRMGIRGVDILKLQVNDFDWKNKTVSFVQQKTGKAITLPVPTDVGNSVYKYIMNGRPESAAAGSGYIFIRHQAPYIPLKVTTACRGALKRILAEYGFELSAGQGFHMTRKTFATRMLRAGSKLDDISSALGHARPETAEVYLERDEDKMRLCPLGFGGVLS